MTSSSNSDSSPLSGLSPHELLAGGLKSEASDLTRKSEFGGAQIGPYRLVEPIGEGGMGVVYLAEQSEPVVREVAFKIIKRGMDSDKLVQRFELERQTLASLEHPNIARILDAGTVPDGRPYLVMELVEGVPITLYCEREKLDVPGRLDLIAQACRGVEDAHRRGVIHRDLKPSNLLVTDGASPQVKIIDFGVAKMVRAGGSSAQTVEGQILGTPPYMSPEQAAGGAKIDTRTDLYSLGAVLYELLTGAPPFPAERFEEAGPVEIARIIREEDPPRPQQRNSSEELHYRDELVWIVLRALEKDPARRYSSVSEFAEDLRRYLSHCPVAAGPPSARYRAQKFLRRHRTLSLAAAALAVTGSVGVWKSIEVGVAKRERNMAMQITTRESQKSQVVIMFVNEILTAMDVDDPVQRRKDLLMAVTFFENQLLPRPEQSPEAEFLGYQMLGAAYKALDRFDEAERVLLLAQGLALTMPIPREDLILIQSVDRDLGAVYQQQGRHHDAARVLESLDRLLVDRLGWHYPERFLTLNMLASSLREIGLEQEAREVAAEALRQQNHHPRP